MADVTATDARCYLDHNATSPLRTAARAALAEALAVFGNPSSIHAEGRAARALLETARKQVASLLDRSPEDVAFLSGATEAANLALSPAVAFGGSRCARLLASAGEHDCVLRGHRFAPERFRTLRLRGDGTLDLEDLEAALEKGEDRPMLALQAANNETGVVQPVVEAARLVHQRGGVLVCDAVQAFGRIDCKALLVGADVIFLSGHKLGGPKGCGALAFRRKDLHIEETLVRGGGQERGLRGGTENVLGAVGLGAAAAEAGARLEAEAERLAGLRDAMERRLAEVAPGVAFFGQGARRLPNTSCFARQGTKAETMVIALDLAGFAVSSGSACSSGKVRPSHVLTAMGIDPSLVAGALRVSFGWSSAASEAAAFCEAYEKSLRRMGLRRVERAA